MLLLVALCVCLIGGSLGYRSAIQTPPRASWEFWERVDVIQAAGVTRARRDRYGRGL